MWSFSTEGKNVCACVHACVRCACVKVCLRVPNSSLWQVICKSNKLNTARQAVFMPRVKFEHTIPVLESAKMWGIAFTASQSSCCQHAKGNTDRTCLLIFSVTCIISIDGFTGWTVLLSNLGGGQVFCSSSDRPWAHPASCTMDTESLARGGGYSGWGVALTTHPI
jgi:hypothetical protein